MSLVLEIAVRTITSEAKLYVKMMSIKFCIRCNNNWKSDKYHLTMGTPDSAISTFTKPQNSGSLYELVT